MFCKHCGNEIDEDVIICTKCGKQVQELKKQDGQLKKVTDNFASDKEAWYFETWFIILMFIFCFPVGIILLVLKNR